MSAEAEQPVLTGSDILISVAPKRSGAERFAKALTWGGGLLAGLGKVALDKRWMKTFEKGDVKPGDIEGLLDRWIPAKEVILTDKDIAVRYQVGFRHKEDRMLVFPLQYAVSAEDDSKLLRKSIFLNFLVPAEERAVEFKLRLTFRRKQEQQQGWLSEILRIISSRTSVPSRTNAPI